MLSAEIIAVGLGTFNADETGHEQSLADRKIKRNRD